MERDLAAIQAKLTSLEKEAANNEKEHPEEAAIIRERITQIQIIWEQLTQMLKERDAKLEEAGDLHRFLRDLDHFQVSFNFLTTFFHNIVHLLCYILYLSPRHG